EIAAFFKACVVDVLRVFVGGAVARAGDVDHSTANAAVERVGVDAREDDLTAVRACLGLGGIDGVGEHPSEVKADLVVVAILVGRVGGGGEDALVGIVGKAGGVGWLEALAGVFEGHVRAGLRFCVENALDAAG